MITALVPDAILLPIFGFGTSKIEIVIAAIVAAFTAPYSAHFLSVLYYRLTERERRVIDPSVRGWPSVWKGLA